MGLVRKGQARAVAHGVLGVEPDGRLPALRVRLAEKRLLHHPGAVHFLLHLLVESEDEGRVAAMAGHRAPRPAGHSCRGRCLRHGKCGRFCRQVLPQRRREAVAAAVRLHGAGVVHHAIRLPMAVLAQRERVATSRRILDNQPCRVAHHSVIWHPAGRHGAHHGADLRSHCLLEEPLPDNERITPKH